MMLRCGGDDDVGKSWGVALAARPISHRAGDPRGRRIEGKDTITVKVQDRIEPCCQIGALAPGALAPQFGDSVHDLRHCYGRHE